MLLHVCKKWNLLLNDAQQVFFFKVTGFLNIFTVYFVFIALLDELTFYDFFPLSKK